MKRAAIVLSLAGLAAGPAATLPAAAAPHGITPCENAVRGDMRATSYEAVMHSKREGQMLVETIDVQKPDRFRTSVPGGRDSIRIGNRQWYYFMGGWQEMPQFASPGTAQAPKDPAKAFVDKPNFICKDAGVVKLHGQAAHEFKSLYNSGEGNVETTMFVFPDGFIHHVNVVAKRSTTSFDYAKFNAVRIDPPPKNGK